MAYVGLRSTQFSGNGEGEGQRLRGGIKTTFKLKLLTLNPYSALDAATVKRLFYTDKHKTTQLEF